MIPTLQPHSTEDFRVQWKEALTNKTFRVQLILAVVTTIIASNLLVQWIHINETRISMPINDPILSAFDPIDLSMPICIITNFGLMLGLIASLLLPCCVIRTLIGIAMIALLRIVTLYLLPLEPPVNIIPLRDIFLESTFYGGKVLTKDLFFSGHTSSLVLLAFFTPFKKVRWLLFFCAAVVGSMLILQHVHYSIDVVLAPVFALFVFFICTQIKAIQPKQTT